ncbi:MAG: Unknown protein [uncultured Sulfurovum sp.]|uniref:Lipoprotein n=1 Tax=uncultured Sulfurovum sp. TaxID=269237 RepID=A0A6S6TZT6_9BACT|nr:MAG: Unknown protein [uncultured Sulfurovum sp.]
MKQKNILYLLIPILLLTSCTNNYHYSSQPETTATQIQIQTDIQTLKFTKLNGLNIQSTDQWNFKLYFKEALKKRTFLRLDSNSPNILDIRVSISPLITKKYKDSFLKVPQFHLDKSISMIANYKVKDKNGRVIVSEIYNSSTQNTEVSTHNYREAEKKHMNKHSKTKLHEKLMRKLAKTVVSQIIDERKIK